MAKATGSAMKKTKTMKRSGTMKKSMKTKHVSKIARGKRAKLSVYLGKKEKTQSGLTKGDLVKNKRGKIVSKKVLEGVAKIKPPARSLSFAPRTVCVPKLNPPRLRDVYQRQTTILIAGYNFGPRTAR